MAMGVLTVGLCSRLLTLDPWSMIDPWSLVRNIPVCAFGCWLAWVHRSNSSFSANQTYTRSGNAPNTFSCFHQHRIGDTENYSLFTTHYSLLTTYYLLLTTYYSLLASHYSRAFNHHCPRYIGPQTTTTVCKHTLLNNPATFIFTFTITSHLPATMGLLVLHNHNWEANC